MKVKRNLVKLTKKEFLQEIIKSKYFFATVRRSLDLLTDRLDEMGTLNPKKAIYEVEKYGEILLHERQNVILINI